MTLFEQLSNVGGWSVEPPNQPPTKTDDAKNEKIEAEKKSEAEILPEKKSDDHNLDGITIPLEGWIETEDGPREYFVCDHRWLWIVNVRPDGGEHWTRTRRL